MKKTILSLLTFGALALESSACGGYGIDLNTILDGTDEQIAAAAKSFRLEGEIGLQEVLEVSPTEKSHPKYSDFVDQIAKQKDALKSKLFWHTDFDQALKLAKETDRPVLSLRLLGKLDEEFSCANSRLFREVLYSDPKISNFLRHNFVLHWKTVRPVPVMTIDFGDGRTLKRTITGNSVHYVTDQSGRVFDVFPGLYTAEKFLQHLQVAKEFDMIHASDSSETRSNSLRNYHMIALAKNDAELLKRLESCGISKHRISTPIKMTDFDADEWATITANQQKENRAARANALTVSKSFTEAPLIEVAAKSELEEKRRANLKKNDCRGQCPQRVRISPPHPRGACNGDQLMTSKSSTIGFTKNFSRCLTTTHGLAYTPQSTSPA